MLIENSKIQGYIVWLAHGGLRADVVELLQIGVAEESRGSGVGKILVTTGRKLYDAYRQSKKMKPVRFAIVSTGLTNHVASALYRKYLLDPLKTYAAGMANVYHGHPELYLGGEVKSYEDLAKEGINC